MAEFPALPLFTDAYLRDCWHLSDAEHGRYFLLMMLIWQTPSCRIPNNREWIARKLRRTPEQYDSDILPLISEFCENSGNWITQKRLTKERDYLRGKSKSQSNRAKSRWNKEKDLYPEDADPHHSGNAPTPTPTPTPKIERDLSEMSSDLLGNFAISKNKSKSAYPEKFEQFWKSYPNDKGMSKAEALAPWKRLSEQDQDLAIAALPEFKKWVAKQGAEYRTIHACRYLKYRRFDGFSTAQGSDIWTSRLDLARRKKQWDLKNWGPMPGQANCAVPKTILAPDDGVGWQVWRQVA
jgi:uncharacterized protein YdaU (DUF1376 family)